jgi:hypothetical protein
VSGESSFIVQTSIGSSYEVEQLISVGSTLISGSAIFGDLSGFSKYMDTGIHQFLGDDFEVDSHCIFIAGSPVLFSVSGGLIKKDGDVDISTLGRLQATSTTTNDGFDNIEHNLIFSLQEPADFLDKCLIPENMCECPVKPIEKINTVFPDANGNINIISDGVNFNVLELESYENNIIISVVGSSKEVCDLGLPASDGLLPSEQQ